MTPGFVLGIDQAARSGWAIYDIRTARPLEHGVVPNHSNARTANAARIAVVYRALEHARSPDNLLVVFEDHSDISLDYKTRHDRLRRGAAPKRNVATFLGMGGALARWEDRLDDANHPERLRLFVTMDDWRKRVLGMSCYTGSERLKKAALTWASQIAGEPILDDNQAEALALGRWGTLDGIAVLLGMQVDKRQKQLVAAAKKKQRVLTTPDGEEIAE